jgi:hypothetical protein
LPAHVVRLQKVVKVRDASDENFTSTDAAWALRRVESFHNALAVPVWLEDTQYAGVQRHSVYFWPSSIVDT